MRRVLPALALVAMLGCGRDDPAAPAVAIDDVDAAEALWLSQHITSYDVDQAITCFCAGPHGWTAVVRDGEVLSQGYTVETIFQEIRQARADADSYQASFDPQLGYPTAFYVDWNVGMADEEWGIRLSNLRRAPKKIL